MRILTNWVGPAERISSTCSPALTRTVAGVLPCSTPSTRNAAPAGREVTVSVPDGRPGPEVHTRQASTASKTTSTARTAATTDRALAVGGVRAPATGTSRRDLVAGRGL